MNKLLRPRFISFLIILLFSAQLIHAQEVIHCWNFNSPTETTGNRFPSPVNVTNRIIGDGTITHDLEPATTQSVVGSTQNACLGSGAGSAFTVRAAATLSNNNKNIDFNFSTEGFENIVLSFWTRRSTTGFNDNQVQYSTDGGDNFNDLVGGNYNPTSDSGGEIKTFNLSNSLPDVNDEAQLVIRININGASNAAGNNLIDNLKLEGTPINSNDEDSVVIIPDTQVPSKTLTALDFANQAESIFSFDIQDLGTSDALPTNVTRMQFLEGPNNTVNWSTAINSLVLRDELGNEITGNFSVSGGEIIFEPDTPLSIADGTSENYTIEAVLNETGIIDRSVIQLSISEVDADFEANNSGSQFTNIFPAEVLGNEITIDVVATDIAFLQQPTDTARDLIMQPAVELGFVDVNGNLDIDITSEVSLESSGDLDGEPVSVDAVNGVATFSNLIHTSVATGRELNASTADPFSATSGTFEIFLNDQTSEVVAPGTQTPGIALAPGDQAEVFNFNIEDKASGDGVSTFVTQMRFVPGEFNNAGWSNTINEVIVKDAGGAAIPGTYSTITDDEVIFTPTASVEIADGGSDNFSVEVILNLENIIDGSIIQFEVAETNPGFQAEATGSNFNSNFTNGSVTGNQFTINVVATAIDFIQQPTDVEVNAFISPAVQVGYVDENGNIDTSITTDISLASSIGNLVDPINPVPAVNGVATFPNIGYTAEATGVILTAGTNEPTISTSPLDSNPFDVGTPVIAIQDFDGTQPEWLFSTSIPTFDNGWGNGFFGVINSDDASPLASGSFVNNIFGENDLNDNNGDGTSEFASLEFVTVDISGYTDVNFSFDWEVVGYNVSSDRIEYEVFFDGVSEGRNTLFEGGTTEDASGTFTLSIPDTVSEVSFSYFIQNDGLTGYSGLDNVKLTGNSNARDTDIIEPIAGQIPEGTLIADVNDELAEAVEVFSFEVVDSGNFDNLPTNITRLRFVPGALNTANWEDVIQGLSISDGTTILDQGNQTLTITPTEILLDIDSDPDTMFSVNDASSKTYTISLFLNESGITDQEVIQFAVADGNENQLASSDGSLFSNAINAFEGSEFLIDVVGDGLEFIVQPTTTVLGENMTPAVRVANTDTNGNLDLDSVGTEVVIESTGSLDGEPITQSITSPEGYANFNTLQHSALGFGLTLSANASGFTEIVSNEFDIIFETDLLISEVAAPDTTTGINEDARFVELFNMSVETLDFSERVYYLHNATTGESIELSGTIQPKSYYIISFADATTFSGIYNGVTPDLVSADVVTSDGLDAYFISVFDTEGSLIDIHGTLAETGGKPTWEYSTGRFYRNIPTVRNSNPVYDEAGEWIKETGISELDATPGVGDNDFVYSNDTDGWIPVGIGESPEGSSGGLNDDKSIFIENGTVTLLEDNLISDVVVRAGATLILDKAITLNGDFANFGKVIFRSTEKETAALGPFDGNNRSLVGTDFEIQRFIPENNRAFRYLSSPVITTTSINDNWQEGVNNEGTVDVDPANNINPNPGFGTHITGSENGQNGFDATLTGNPSMFRWNAVNQEWVNVPNTDSETFAAGSAYSILIRGDRSTNLNSNSAVGPSTTLRTTGRLVVGSRGVQNVATSVGGFSLVGNPYQAKVDMQTLLGSGNSSGVSSQFVYIYDPTLGSFGGYATVDFSDGTTTPSNSAANQFLDPNQAFFVETVSAAASPAIVFRESYKSTDVNNNATFSVPEDLTNLNINLFAENTNAPIDGLKVKFRADGNNAKDTLDATKVWNYEESFAIDRNPNYMSIESRAMPTAQDSVPFYFGNATRSNYRFEIEPENFTNAKAFLYDRYLETLTELPSDVSTSVSFELDNSIPASKATDRFVIKFEEVSLSDDDFELDSSLVVYPNPVRGELIRISHNKAFSGNDVDFKIFDLQGRLVLDQEIDNAPTVEVNIGSNLSSGVYILKLSDGTASQSVKLIVE
ncbi:beta strand repeat-containing protein [Psychroflexus montanilacus]|uniref:beta strand repeat-containing protein n=1 Tax=Psychroflexus montanilacus TaxID=2873598 RepID=UPI001CCF77BF|nr:T9SS type A sorting domain-containing protein [Psychroflexus montanilacus]MBZ9652586.1 T9SS type A sorting domain-containing protein [Psychroflexus montanilacus]